MGWKPLATFLPILALGAGRASAARVDAGEEPPVLFAWLLPAGIVQLPIQSYQPKVIRTKPETFRLAEDGSACLDSTTLATERLVVRLDALSELLVRAETTGQRTGIGFPSLRVRVRSDGVTKGFVPIPAVRSGQKPSAYQLRFGKTKGETDFVELGSSNRPGEQPPLFPKVHQLLLEVKATTVTLRCPVGHPGGDRRYLFESVGSAGLVDVKGTANANGCRFLVLQRVDGTLELCHE